MRIKHTNYSEGVHYFTLSEPAGSLGLDDRFKGDILVDCKMDKSHGQISLVCDITVPAILNCDRCTEEFESTLKSHFQMVYLFSKSTKIENQVDLKYIAPDQDKIDISEEVYQYTVLSVPMKTLCREDCRGLCPKCGKNLNEGSCNCKEVEINPVWEALKKSREDFNNK